MSGAGRSRSAEAVDVLLTVFRWESQCCFAWASTSRVVPPTRPASPMSRAGFSGPGRRFRTTPQDLVQLWSMLPEGADPADVLVVMEPTRNAWVPLAALTGPQELVRG